jgi:hypothetical protein
MFRSHLPKLLKQCKSLESSLNTLNEAMSSIEYSREGDVDPELIDPLFDRVFAFLQERQESPTTFDEIDAMLAVARHLLDFPYLRTRYYSRFILACPEKFMVTYMNNPEKTPALIRKLRKYDMVEVAEVLFPHIHESRRHVWAQRSDHVEPYNGLNDSDED